MWAELLRDGMLLATSVMTLVLWTAGTGNSYQLGWLVDLLLLTGAGILVVRIIQTRQMPEG